MVAGHPTSFGQSNSLESGQYHPHAANQVGNLSKQGDQLERYKSVGGDETIGSMHSRSDVHKSTNPTGIQVRLDQLREKTTRAEVLKQEFEKLTRKPSFTEGFKLGKIVSNFMVGAIADLRNEPSTGLPRWERSLSRSLLRRSLQIKKSSVAFVWLQRPQWGRRSLIGSQYFSRTSSNPHHQSDRSLKWPTSQVKEVSVTFSEVLSFVSILFPATSKNLQEKS